MKDERGAGVSPAGRGASRAAVMERQARRPAPCGRDARSPLLLAALLFSANAFAATATSAITGRVNSGGVPVSGVTVTVTSTVLQGERTTVTTATGRYWLTALPPGRYDVTFSRSKLQTLTRRVVVELARVSRADAVLEPSEDEEHITSTAIPLSVAETTAATSHFSEETLDRLPIRRDPLSAVLIAPGQFGPLSGFVNDAIASSGDMSFESLEQLTLLRAALPADHEPIPAVFHVQTRSGGENYFFSLRDTITNVGWIATDFPAIGDYEHGLEQTVELNAGGRIVKERLWFFASAWKGREAFLGDREGYDVKLTWQPGGQHHLMGYLSDGQGGTVFFEPQATVAAVRYTGMAGPRWTNEAVLSRTSTGNPGVVTPVPAPRFHVDSLFARTSYITGDHVLSAGGRATSSSYDDSSSFFINDRWMAHRFTVNAGARFEHDRFAPRLSAAFDVRGNGRQAITASLSDHASPVSRTREATVGFATAVGTTGSIRADAFHRDYGNGKNWGVMGDFRYTLFDRFHTGASYTWYRSGPEFFAVNPAHTVQAWAGVDLPLGEHEAGITALQRFRSRWLGSSEVELQTDLALRYSLPVSRLRLTVALDTQNLFDRRPEVNQLGRAFGGWIRLRM